jgi:hypothetical protein
MKLIRNLKLCACVLLTVTGMIIPVGPAGAAQLRVRQADGSTVAQEVDPRKVRVTGRSDERTTWVCVEISGQPSVWAKQAAWMATVESSRPHGSADPGYTTGSGNGFGGASLLQIVATC